MPIKIYIENNFLVLDDGTKNEYIIQSQSDFDQLTKNGYYEVYDTISKVGKIDLWSNFQDQSGSQLAANEADFVLWLSQNAGNKSNTGSSSGSNPVYVNQVPVMRTNVDVPAGFIEVTIMRLSGTITVDSGDGTTIYAGGASPRGISISGSVFGDSNGILPSLTITGGTWQWVGMPQI